MPTDPPQRPTLGSWKEIAAFLRRDSRTVQRWERDEALPVHRHQHLRRNSVYAYPEELERWWQGRGANQDRRVDVPARGGRPWVIGSGLVAVVAAGGMLFLQTRRALVPEAPATLGRVVANGAPLVMPGSIAVSPDGTTLYVSDWGANAIFTMPADGGSPRVLASLEHSGFSGLNSARLLSIAGDGRTLYVAGWKTATIFSVSTVDGAITLLASGPPLEHPHGIFTSRDSSLLFITDNLAGKLFRLPAAGGTPVLLASNLSEPLDVAAAGSMLFVACGDGSIWAMQHAADKTPRRIVSGPPLVRPTGLSVSPDESTIYVADDAGFGGHPPGVIYALSVATGVLTRVYSGPPMLFPPDLAVSPDGVSLFVSDTGYGATGAVYRLDLFRSITLDVDPASRSNIVVPESDEPIAVAVMSTPEFDASTIDPATVRFGPRQATELHGRGHFEDVDGDGDRDLLLHFSPLRAGLTCGTTTVSLQAATWRGERLRGIDRIVTSGCH